MRTWQGDNDNDDFNRLVLLAGLDWRGVGLLRAYMRYMKQASFTFSRAYIQQALAKHAAIAADLVALFHARFDPALEGDRDAAQAKITARITAALDAVSNLDEDRILRQYLALIQATLRTNYFQRGTDGGFKPVMSFKFDPSKVPGLPEPKPMFEIFVSSPRVEGVHLRGGQVARGGLRWSDRIEDFRTEVLGLVKAQQVKNAVIVPVGSKGGFVLKRAAAGRRPRGADEGRHRLLPGLPARPARPHRQPGRRRGRAARPTWCATTATTPTWWSPPTRARRPSPTSPTRTAAEYGFWLGDAFASGGSAGYDHKKMGITARGAWESVKYHFRSLGHDTQIAGLHGRRRRRHERRRVRQRHAAVAPHPAAGRLRPPPHLHRPEPRRRDQLRRARAPVRAAALVLGPTTTRPDLGRRRRLAAQRQVDPALSPRRAPRWASPTT